MATALVTGATSGLGAAFVRRLAAEHHDLILVARDTARLDQVAAELAERAVAVEVLPADLASESGCARVENRLRDADRPVDILVNNAGMALTKPFHLRDVADHDRLTRLNVLAVMRLSHAALQVMVPRGRGDILNVSSVAGFTPAARTATYAASKAWVTAFSEGLHQQYAPMGIRVLALCPGYVHTELHGRAGMNMAAVPDWLWQDPEEVVATGLRALRRGRPLAVTGLPYKAIVGVTKVLPRGLVRAASDRVRRRTT